MWRSLTRGAGRQGCKALNRVRELMMMCKTGGKNIKDFEEIASPRVDTMAIAQRSLDRVTDTTSVAGLIIHTGWHTVWMNGELCSKTDKI